MSVFAQIVDGSAICSYAGKRSISTSVGHARPGDRMLRPFIPAKDHDQSRRFYEALGFTTEYADDSVAVMSNGIDSFILQNFYVKELADNFMVQLAVADVAAWWTKYDPDRLADEFGTNPPTSPSIQPWGLVVGFIQDPSGVLWHLTEASA